MEIIARRFLSARLKICNSISIADAFFGNISHTSQKRGKLKTKPRRISTKVKYFCTQVKSSGGFLKGSLHDEEEHGTP